MLSLPHLDRFSRSGTRPGAVRVWIVVLWGDDVLSVTSLRRGQRFRLAGSPGAPALPEELLGTPALTLVTHDRPSPRLWIPPKAEGWFSAPASEPCALKGMHSASLELGSHARLEFGPFTVLISCTTVGPRFQAHWHRRSIFGRAAIASPCGPHGPRAERPA